MPIGDEFPGPVGDIAFRSCPLCASRCNKFEYDSPTRNQRDFRPDEEMVMVNLSQ